MLLCDFWHHTMKNNLCQAESRLDDVISATEGQLKTMLIMNADRMLASEDTETLFWQRVCNSSKDNADSLKMLFSSLLQYLYTAFHQAMLIYEEAINNENFDALCQDVVFFIVMYSEFMFLLQLITEQEHVAAVVITCGLCLVWKKMLKREDLFKQVKVIDEGCIADSFVITAAVKAVLMTCLQNVHEMYVWAFRDSLLNLKMLSRADQVIIVIDEEKTRSKMIKINLFNAIYDDDLWSHQTVLSSHVLSQLNTKMLSLIQLTLHNSVHVILQHHCQDAGIQALHATVRKATKLLMTLMWNAINKRSTLREAHHCVEWYLVTELLCDVISIVKYSILHVQSHQTSDYWLFEKQRTSIVVLMRSEEVMILDVNNVLLLVMFVHVNKSNNIMLHHLQGQSAVLLVNSVVNSNKTVMNFVWHKSHHPHHCYCWHHAGPVHFQWQSCPPCPTSKTQSYCTSNLWQQVYWHRYH